MIQRGLPHSDLALPWLAVGLRLLFTLSLAMLPRAVCAAPANSMSMQTWQTEQGLADDTITAIAQTPSGHLWVGTGRGLVRFDGLKFEVMRGLQGLEEGPVSQLFVEKSGALWVSMQSGALLRAVGGRFESFGAAARWTPAPVRFFAQPSDGIVYLCTANGDGWRYHDGQFERIQEGESEGRITGLAVDRWGSGTLWVRLGLTVGMWTNGLWHAVAPAGDPVAPVRLGPMTPRRAGGVWLFAAERRLDVLKGSQWEPLARPYPAFMDPNCLLEDTAGCLWIGTHLQGLVQLGRNGEVQRHFTGTGFPGDAVSCLFEDRDENIWVGTSGSGLVRLHRPDVVAVDSAGFPKTSPLCIVEDAAQVKWVSFAEAGLYRLSETNVIQRNPALQRTSWALLARSNGELWSGVYGRGLMASQGDQQRMWTEREKLPSNDIRALVEDAAGGLWIGSVLGVARFDGTNFVDMGERHGFRLRDVLTMAVDGSGAVWAGMRYGGLVRFREGTLDLFTTTNGLPSNHVRALQPDGARALWIGTAEGLCRFDGTRLFVFGQNAGLPAREIQGIVEDQTGHVWLSASRGILRVPRAELQALEEGRASRVSFRAFGVEDGLPSVRLTRGNPSAIQARDGTLWFTTLKGMAKVDPASLRPPPPPSPVLIEEVRVDGKPLQFSVDGLGWQDRPLEIGPGPRRIEIRYSSANFHTPARMEFKSRLEGLEDDWQPATRERSVVFHGLRPGQYRLQVALSDSGSGVEREGATLGFVVQPWFWETGWFRGAVGMLGILGVGGVFRLRTRSLEQQRKAQEMFSRQLIDRQEAERQRIAAELHDSLGQSLAVVKNLAILGKTGRDAVADGRLEEISSAAGLALDEMHAISYALRPPELDRLGLALALEGMIRRAEEATRIRFTHHLELDGAALPAGADIHLFRIAQEAVSNLLKHSSATSARVELWKDEAGVHLVVADDGRGFMMGTEGVKAGLGLSGMVERVHLLGGRHELVSRPGQGTTLSVLIPIAALPARE